MGESSNDGEKERERREDERREEGLLLVPLVLVCRLCRFSVLSFGSERRRRAKKYFFFFLWPLLSKQLPLVLLKP